VITIRLCTTMFGAVLLMAIGCGQDEKIANLEKQNQALRAEMDKSHTAADYDLQAKCSKDARAWFNENWSRDKDTILLDFTNHYNESMNKCFILVEYHYSYGRESSWANDMSLWDVYENAKYANISDHHITYYTPTIKTEENVVECQVSDKKCTSLGEFNNLTGPYLSN
jgi:hypothetical protein